MPRRLYERPILAALTGAVAISFSGILYRVAHVSPSTGAVFRCLYAMPPGSLSIPATTSTTKTPNGALRRGAAAK